MDEKEMVEHLKSLGYRVEEPRYTPELGDLFIDDDGDLGLHGPDGVRYTLTVGGGMVSPIDMGTDSVESIVPVRRVANVLEILKVGQHEED
jgi:hypothetical protein